MQKIFLFLLCPTLAFCLGAPLTYPQREYIESVDSFCIGHGRFVVGHYSIAHHTPGKVVFLKTVRASKKGIYYLSKDVIDVKDIPYMYDILPEKPSYLSDQEWREIYSQVFDLPDVEEVDEEKFAKEGYP